MQRGVFPREVGDDDYSARLQPITRADCTVARGVWCKRHLGTLKKKKKKAARLCCVSVIFLHVTAENVTTADERAGVVFWEILGRALRCGGKP